MIENLNEAVRGCGGLDKFAKFTRKYDRFSPSTLVGMAKIQEWNFKELEKILKSAPEKDPVIKQHPITLFQHDDLTMYFRVLDEWAGQLEVMPFELTVMMSTERDEGLNKLLDNPRIREKIILAANYKQFKDQLVLDFKELTTQDLAVDEFAKKLTDCMEEGKKTAITLAKAEANKQFGLEGAINTAKKERRVKTFVGVVKSIVGGVGTAGAFASSAVTGPFGAAGGYVALHCALKTIVSTYKDIRIMYGGIKKNLKDAESEFSTLHKLHIKGIKERTQALARVGDFVFSDIINPIKNAKKHLSQAQERLLEVDKKASDLAQDIDVFLKLSRNLETEIKSSKNSLIREYETKATSDKLELIKVYVEDVSKLVDIHLAPLYGKINVIFEQVVKQSEFYIECDGRITNLLVLQEITEDSKGLERFFQFMDLAELVYGVVGSGFNVGGGFTGAELASGLNPMNESAWATAANITGLADAGLDTFRQIIATKTNIVEEKLAL